MADINVKSYIDELRKALPYVPPVPVQKIKELHRKREFGRVVRLIRETMNIGVNLTLHWTSEARPNAKAWIKIPGRMPHYGTPEFKNLKMDIFILKSFRDGSRYDEFALAVAHELSHVVLESIEHPLRSEEKAVDLTAMLLGFSYLYRVAAHSVRRVGYNVVRTSQLGYLSKYELNAACKLLVPRRMRARRAALIFLSRAAPLLGLIGFYLVSYALMP